MVRAQNHKATSFFPLKTSTIQPKQGEKSPTAKSTESSLDLPHPVTTDLKFGQLHPGQLVQDLNATVPLFRPTTDL